MFSISFPIQHILYNSIIFTVVILKMLTWGKISFHTHCFHKIIVVRKQSQFLKLPRLRKNNSGGGSLLINNDCVCAYKGFIFHWCTIAAPNISDHYFDTMKLIEAFISFATNFHRKMNSISLDWLCNLGSLTTACFMLFSSLGTLYLF